MERPFACVVLREGQQLTSAELLDFLAGRVERWGLPDGIEFLDEIPKTSVGKFSKRTLRERFADRQLGRRPTDARRPTDRRSIRPGGTAAPAVAGPGQPLTDSGGRTIGAVTLGDR